MATVQRSKGTIRFSFKESFVSLSKEPKKESLIFLFFNYGKDNRFKYSTRIFSCYADWDRQRQRIRNKAHILDRDYNNDYLNRIESEFSKEISYLNAHGLPLNKKHLTEKLDLITGKTNPINNEENYTIISYYDHFLERKKDKIKEGTRKSHNQTKRVLTEFNKKLEFEDVNHDFYDSFIAYLYTKNYADNTIGKYIKNLKVIMNSAANDGINTNFVYKQRDFRVFKEETTQIYLNEDEIEKIAQCDLSDFPRKELARDIFLIGCYTGQRISDFNGLSNDNVIARTKNGKTIKFFKIKHQKTGNTVFCPITKEIKAILSKPRYQNSPPPKMNEQDINEFIKEIGRKVGITENVIVERTKGGIKTKEKVPKYRLIVTHTARRSFCSNMFKKQMPVYHIMTFSGHSSEREFYKYIRLDKEEKSLNILEGGYFNI
nr:site-specific integrase [uncultured Allomuricauda sp.]